MSNLINCIFSLRHARFVNDGDIATIIPPLSQHVGCLIHFDRQGHIKSPEEESVSLMGSEKEAPALTEEQFKEMQNSLKRTDGENEGNISGAADHAIGGYIGAMKKHSDGMI